MVEIEEEGRKAWLQSHDGSKGVQKDNGKNYGVEVGRSGGGV
jgi:hypothetical protein